MTTNHYDVIVVFARTNAGVTSPADFFSDENTGRVLAASRPVAVP